MWGVFRSYATHQAFAKEDRRRLRGRLVLHRLLWISTHECFNAVQIFYMSGNSKYYSQILPPDILTLDVGLGCQHPDWPQLRSKSGLHPSPLHPTRNRLLSSPNFSRCTHATAHLRLLHFCFSHRSIRRLLRFGTQTILQNQRLWRIDTRARRHYRSDGLPVHHGFLHFCLLPEFHCRAQG